MRDKRRLIEWGKDGLIVLLTLSAVWLLSMTPLVRDSGLPDLFFHEESPGTGTSAGDQAAAMLPVRLAVTGEGGRCGVQYDEALLEGLGDTGTMDFWDLQRLLRRQMPPAYCEENIIRLVDSPEGWRVAEMASTCLYRQE